MDAAAQMTGDTAPASRKIDDLAALLYTSGTTGAVKGAMLTQGNLLSNAEVLVGLWQFTARDRLIHALPIYHVHGLFVATNVMLLAGGEMIFMPGFDADAIIDAMDGATTLMGVPTFYTRLLDSPRLGYQAASSMRLFISGSAPLLASTHEDFAARTGQRILERYGMTETGMNTSNPYDGDRRAGTVGLPLPGVEVIVTDPETEMPCAAGSTGMIEVRGPNVFTGYWGMAEKTAADLRDNGFFITGDLGVIDDDGYVTIVGRNRDLIISGGFNIYPREIELLIDAARGSGKVPFSVSLILILVKLRWRLLLLKQMRCLILTRSPRGSVSHWPVSSIRGIWKLSRPCRAIPWARCRKISCAISMPTFLLPRARDEKVFGKSGFSLG